MVPPKAADGLVEPSLDVSWIRVDLLLSAASHRISSADIVADLARLGFKYRLRSIARIMRGRETKGYLAQTPPRRDGSGRVPYTTTHKGRTVSKALRRHLWEFFDRTGTS